MVEYAVELRNQAARCNFGNKLSIRLSDQLITSVLSDVAIKKLMEGDDISLEDAEKLASDIERVDQKHKAVFGEQSAFYVNNFMLNHSAIFSWILSSSASSEYSSQRH